GIPGKKCGTIILSAEELGNCRLPSKLSPKLHIHVRCLERCR
ncbi:copine-5-like, partial [Tachysurus ichikawai]